MQHRARCLQGKDTSFAALAAVTQTTENCDEFEPESRKFRESISNMKSRLFPTLDQSEERIHPCSVEDLFASVSVFEKSLPMQLRHLKNALPATEGMCKVTAIVWSPNNKRLAVVTVDRIVHLFDAATGERKDKFSTKPAEKGAKDYVVRSMEFSPDSTKLAIAQSDNIVFVYKIGLEWGDKKSICNKFPQSQSVTSLTWPISHPNEIVFGLADGKVKLGQLRNNKPATLYNADSYVYALASNLDGNAIVSSHLDHSIYRFFFDDPNGGLFDFRPNLAVHLDAITRPRSGGRA